MPNYYAHLQFGVQVLAALPEDLRTRLEGEMDGYTLGQYGPDPLYFYRAVRGGAVRAVGRELHRQPVRPVMERLRRAAEEGRRYSLGYAAGFLCHFALDSRCHAYIGRKETGGKITHASLEAEFDRFLMVRGGLEPARETPLPVPDMPDVFYELLERYVYLGVRGRQYREGLRFYQKVSGWHTRTAGSQAAGRCLELAARTSHSGGVFRDMVLKREQGPAFARSNEEMLDLFQKEVAVTAEKLHDFFAGKPMDRWFDRDFHGGI